MADPSEPSEESPEPVGDDGDPGAAGGEQEGPEPAGTGGDGPEGSEAAGMEDGSRGASETVEAEVSEPPRDPETLQGIVEERYDFEHFSPADMAEMTAEEWEAAFDPDTWITGPELLDRVEADLRSRVARREVFAVVERTEVDGAERVLAYTDVGYALVAPDGSVEGEGSILEDIEPVVALCSMEDYDVPEPPADAGLPHPDDVDDGVGSIGDRLLLTLAGVMTLAGLVLLVSPVLLDLNPEGPGGGGGLLTTVAGLGFLFIGVVIGVLVANARLSGRFRAEEYRRRLLAAGVGTDERPPFLPVGVGGEATGDSAHDAAEEAAGDAGDEPSERAPE